MRKRLKVAVLFGGRSGEHAVSLRSATSVMDAMDKDKYEIIPVGISENGQWFAGGNPMQALEKKEIPGDCYFAVMVPDPTDPGLLLLDPGNKTSCRGFIPIDAVFPVLHGPYGEDGTVQGLLELANLPYVGAGVLSSAAGMDKAVMKILFQKKGLPVGDYIYFRASSWAGEREPIIKLIEKRLGYPCFVKPANLGSSVGVNKAVRREELIQAIEVALRFDLKVIVEAFISGREIECSVLGDEEPVASVPGEIISCNEFYDYEAKYLDNRSKLIIPAPLEPEIKEKIKEYAVQSFLAVECSGLGRIDFFYEDESRKIYVNEINTIPGFTNISMYPKLWEASGIPYPKLIDRLIEIAMKRFAFKQRLTTSYQA
ncbi:MAG: D-alanine--D-alanine ligase family protein [Dethiobacteria bacterium]